ncbi:MAG: CHAT domain-containing protein, partial [Anaerolineales bacterium]|nr:CHAT domain-containing protein [Anaerolineales bacterium]MDW8163002.1 CHAT domain-containing protein [Anaerolineales bacterium]
CGVLHFSTHGQAGWTKIEDSKLLLAGGVLTLPQVFNLRLERPRLAVLSACETGVPQLTNLDEVLSLPSGLMLAGVPGVIGSLWAVNDQSTALLMAWSYHLWREEGWPMPQALREAQIRLRDGHQDAAVRAELESITLRAGWRMSAEQADDFLTLVQTRDFAHPFFWAAFTYTGL